MCPTAGHQREEISTSLSATCLEGTLQAENQFSFTVLKPFVSSATESPSIQKSHIKIKIKVAN